MAPAGGYKKLLPAAASKPSGPADENRRKKLHTYDSKRVESSQQWPQIVFSLFLFTWIPSFLFLFPRALGPEMLFRMICQGSRKQTAAVEPPSFFCSSSFNNLALRLFPFPDISAAPVVLCFLPRNEKGGERGRCYDGDNAMHLSASTFCVHCLLRREVEERGFQFYYSW